MKRKTILTFFIIIICTSVFADNFIPKEYYGTYIPLKFEEKLIKTNSYSKSLYQNSNYHDILFVGENGCYSDLKFHDGYKIPNISNFNFYKNNDDKFITDENNNIYKAIYSGNEERNYQPFYEFVINHLFQNAKELKNISIENSTITIGNIKLQFITDLMFFDTSTCDAWFYSLDEKNNQRNYYALIKDGIGAKLVKGIRDEDDFGWTQGSEIIYDFPIFFYGGNDYLEYNLETLNLSQIRLMRNLIYAKHGYQFKDQNLSEIFNNFEWYKKNNSFSEDDISIQERNFIQRCKQLEDWRQL